MMRKRSPQCCGQRATAARALIWHGVLNLGEVTRDAYFRFLNEEFPRLVPLYDSLYRGKYAPKAYADKVHARFSEERRHFPMTDRLRIEPRQDGVQLSLI